MTTCSVCADTAEALRLLPCFHAICATCLAAEEGPTVPCVFKVEDGLVCGERYAKTSSVLLISQPEHGDEEENAAGHNGAAVRAMQSEASTRAAQLQVAIDALDETATTTNCTDDVRKALEDQCDALRVVQSQYRAVAAFPSSWRGAIGTAAARQVLDRPVDRRLVVPNVLVRGLPFVVLPWQARDYHLRAHPAQQGQRRVDLPRDDAGRLGRDEMSGGVAFDLEGNLVLVDGNNMDWPVQVIDVSTNTTNRTRRRFSPQGACCAVGVDVTVGNEIVVMQRDDRVMWFDALTGHVNRVIDTTPTQDGDVSKYVAAVSHDGSVVVTSGLTGVVTRMRRDGSVVWRVQEALRCAYGVAIAYRWPPRDDEVDTVVVCEPFNYALQLFALDDGRHLGTIRDVYMYDVVFDPLARVLVGFSGDVPSGEPGAGTRSGFVVCRLDGTRVATIDALPKEPVHASIAFSPVDSAIAIATRTKVTLL